MTIVGVVADVKNLWFSEIDYSNVYVPFAQAPAPSIELIASMSLPPDRVASPLRGTVARLDPGLPIRSVELFTERISASLDGLRFNLMVMAVFASLALAVAGVGIYGSVACVIEERVREFGIRIALGAVPRQIFGAVLRESMRLALAGSLLGIVAVITLSRTVGSALYVAPNVHGGVLYNVTLTHPAVLAAACALVTIAAATAGLSPAWRATRVDPLVVLRAE